MEMYFICSGHVKIHVVKVKENNVLRNTKRVETLLELLLKFDSFKSTSILARYFICSDNESPTNLCSVKI